MHLIQILLPLYDNDGQSFPQQEYSRVRDELMECAPAPYMYMQAAVYSVSRHRTKNIRGHSDNMDGEAFGD